MIRFLPLNIDAVRIMLRNKLGTSVPLILDKKSRGNIFSAIRRDGHCDDSTDIAWLR